MRKLENDRKPTSHGGLALLALLALSASAFWSTGCGPSPTEPELLIQRYFEAVDQQRYDDVLPLYSPLFFEKTPAADWKQSLVDVRQRLGELQSYKVRQPLPEREEGAEGSYRQTLIYIARYSRYAAEETITVFQEPGGGKLHILEHNIRYLQTP